MQTDSHILFEGDGFAIAWKPPLMHSAPLTAGGESLLALHAQRFPDVLSVRGRKSIEGGLLHRLDYETRGLLVFAHRQDVYDALVSCQDEGLFAKEYRALCMDLRSHGTSALPAGFPPSPRSIPVAGMRVESAFRPWGPGRRAVRPLALDALPSTERRRKELSFDRGGPYISEIISINELGISTCKHPDTNGVEYPLVMVRARLLRGFRHQIRVHLAWLGLPLLGDPLYAPQGPSLQDVSSDSAPFFLDACAIQFPERGAGEKVFQYEHESHVAFSTI